MSHLRGFFDKEQKDCQFQMLGSDPRCSIRISGFFVPYRVEVESEVDRLLQAKKFKLEKQYARCLEHVGAHFITMPVEDVTPPNHCISRCENIFESLSDEFT